jgi:CHAT domain-containing protein
MQRFYNLREGSHLATVEALRQAQLGLLRGGLIPLAIKSGKASIFRGAKRLAPAGISKQAFIPDPKAPHSHPYFWAPFILIGNLM